MEQYTGTTRDMLPGEPRALWIGTTGRSDYPSLSGDTTVDVAIVGGGIVGLTAAMLLKKSGARVALVEAGRIAEGVSGHTTAKLTSAHALIYDHLLRKFGEERALQYTEANQAAIEFVSGFIEEHDIACEFQRTFAATYAIDPKDQDKIQAEVKAAGELGLPVFYANSLPIPMEVAGAVCYENQAFFHPRKYLLSIAEQIAGDGSHVFENSRVNKIKEGSPCEVITDRATVRADSVIVATNFPILNRGQFYAKMVPSRSYLVAAKVRGPLPDGMFYSTETPFHTFRKHVNADGQEILIIGGEHHETGHISHTVEHYRKAEAFARKHFHIDSILFRWSAQDNRAVDGVPFIGRHSFRSKRLYVATGLKGWGMTNGTAAAIILSDMINGRQNPWTDVFDPNRFTPFISRKFISRNLHVARMFMQDYVVGEKHRPASEIARGEAGIIEESGRKLAAFKDEKGQMHTVSPACTHMGCKVVWNDGEQSWDCPCHGSRFDPDGHVLHAPATSRLKKE